MAEKKVTTEAVEKETKKTVKKAAPKAKKAAKETVEKAETKTAKKTTTKKAVKTTKETAKKAETKKAETKKVEAKKEAKPVVTSAHAKAISVKSTPRKARLVIDVVRGKDCDEALGLLLNSNHRVSVAVAKVIKSAMANATNNFGLNEDKLYISEIYATDSIKMRRFLPRAKGSASGLVKRFCNIYVTVKERN